MEASESLSHTLLPELHLHTKKTTRASPVVPGWVPEQVHRFIGLDFKFNISDEVTLLPQAPDYTTHPREADILPTDYLKDRLTLVRTKGPIIRFRVGCVEVSFVKSVDTYPHASPEATTHVDFSVEIEIVLSRSHTRDVAKWNTITHDVFCMWLFLSFAPAREARA
jgi:hypothetical protein